jgi:hypothetical protein
MTTSRSALRPCSFCWGGAKKVVGPAIGSYERLIRKPCPVCFGTYVEIPKMPEPTKEDHERARDWLFTEFGEANVLAVTVDSLARLLAEVREDVRRSPHDQAKR